MTAGQGSCVGHRFEHLAEVLGSVKGRSGSASASTPATCTRPATTSRRRAATRRRSPSSTAWSGSRKLRAIHLNDCASRLGSRVDRHAPIGEGHLGLRHVPPHRWTTRACAACRRCWRRRAGSRTGAARSRCCAGLARDAPRGRVNARRARRPRQDARPRDRLRPGRRGARRTRRPSWRTSRAGWRAATRARWRT